MTVFHKNLGDTLYFWATTSQPLTGAAIDADDADAETVNDSPSYSVYEPGNDTPLLTGQMAKKDDRDTLGFYEGSVAISAENGFAEGGTYVVYRYASVPYTDPTSLYVLAHDHFVIQVDAALAELSDLADAIWGVATGDEPGRADNRGRALDQALRAVVNRSVLRADGTMSLYRDDATSEMLTGPYTDNPDATGTEIASERGHLTAP